MYAFVLNSLDENFSSNDFSLITCTPSMPCVPFGSKSDRNLIAVKRKFSLLFSSFRIHKVVCNSTIVRSYMYAAEHTGWHKITGNVSIVDN